jgi:hypothetical protein
MKHIILVSVILLAGCAHTPLEAPKLAAPRHLVVKAVPVPVVAAPVPAPVVPAPVAVAPVVVPAPEPSEPVAQKTFKQNWLRWFFRDRAER